MKKTAKNKFKFLVSMSICILLALVSALVIIAGPSSVYAASLTGQDYAPSIWFNADSYNSHKGWKLVSENREQWENEAQAERKEYFLYKTSKKPIVTTLASVRAYHSKGTETTLQIGASYLTEEEVVNSLGLQAESRIGIVVAKIGGGWKWGNADSRTVTTESTFTAAASIANGYYLREGKVYLQEYYILVRSVKRVVNKDKHGKISYGTYSASIDSNQSGSFENFDIQGGVVYQTVRA